ncbi:MAG TPA: arginine--tRNA ligase [Xanthobacteraceae bacterium]|nr:arginine--tRNA ligase [Xanthobacteraceae bacterium]
MNVFSVFTAHVQAAVKALAAAGVFAVLPDLSRIVVEPPREASHGDLATNAAMVLAKEAGLKPRELAERLAAELSKRTEITAIEVAGPGFINLTLDPGVWRDALRAAILAGPDFGRSDLGKGERVNVEYVSANPTGPLHVGHGRGAVFGDALANLLAFSGFAVTREYYINDAGAQVDTLARSVFLRYREALGEDIGPIPEGFYPGDYLKPVGAALAAEHGRRLNQMPEETWLPIMRAKAIEMMMAGIKQDLAGLNVHHDVFFSERSLIEGPRDQVAATIAALRAESKVYEGRLPPPKGAPVEDWEDREQTLFRATAFGDDVDRPLKKSDGSYTYFASDIAYHKSKVDRGFGNLIDVWGADHGGYIKRMKAAVAAVAAGGDTAVLDVKVIQLVKLLRAGEPVKMSKRTGDFVTLREVVDEVGRDAVRFMMLYRKNDAVLDFDLVKVKEQSRDNPVFYVQYGHARGQSIFRNAGEVLPGLSPDGAERARQLAAADLGRLDDPAEIALMRRIALYPRLVEAAAGAHEPHRVAFYLYELASEFHAQWTKGKDSPHLRFIIQNDPEITMARLALVQGVVTVLASGLGLLGVGAPDEMR